jgi:hypothetical protein
MRSVIVYSIHRELLSMIIWRKMRWVPTVCMEEMRNSYPVVDGNKYITRVREAGYKNCAGVNYVIIGFSYFVNYNYSQGAVCRGVT